MKKYKKLVRDKIPEIIEEDGKKPVTHIASPDEYGEKLKEKLKEEVNEFLDSGNEEELADILEVIEAICDFKNVGRDKIETARKRKAKKKGGFKDRVVLDRVED